MRCFGRNLSLYLRLFLGVLLINAKDLFVGAFINRRHQRRGANSRRLALPHGPVIDEYCGRASPTLAELLMPLAAADPFSTMRASLRWCSSEELEDGVTYGGQSWLRRGSVDSFFSALLLRDGDAGGSRKRSSS